jgi:hypothetical protein
MNSDSKQARRLIAGGPVSVLRDPIVPSTFGDWLPKVFGVFSRSFGRPGALALVPAGLVVLYLVAMKVITPDQAGMQQQIAAVDAADPTGHASPAAEFWAVFGAILPVMLVFLVILTVAGAFYQGCAFYLALRQANGQPTSRS